MKGRATSTTASRFMRRCQQASNAASILTRNNTVRRHQSSTSRYAPSQFNKPYTSPISSPSPVSPQKSNLPGPGSKPAYAIRPSHSEPFSPDPNSSSATTTTTTTRAQPLWARPKALSTPIPPAHSQTSFRNWLRRRVGLPIPTSGHIPPDPFNVWNNPYRAHKKWPPKLLELELTQQLAFEKTFKRRVALKWERPVFKKWVKLVQNSGIALIVFYAVFVFDPDEGTLFDGMRAWCWEAVRDSDLFPQQVRGDAATKAEQYEKTWEDIKASFFEIVPVDGMQKGVGVQVDPEEQKIPWAQRRRSG